MAVSPEQARALALAAARKRQAEQQGQDAPEAAQEPPQRTRFQQFAREQGIGARAAIEGVTGLLTVPADLVGGAIDVGLERIGLQRRFGSGTRLVSDSLTRMGLPVPENETEQTGLNIGRAISAAPAMMLTGGAMAGPSATPVVAGVGRTLAANPALQVASAGTGAIGSEIARRSGGGPVAQMIGGLAGATLPSLAAAGTQALVRGGFRGGEQGRQRVQQNIETFDTAGTSPSVGQAGETRIARAAESGLARVPGSAGRMAAFAETQADEVGAALEQRARQLAGRSVSAEQTGRAIESSIRGSGGFIEKFRETQRSLYDKLDNFIPQDRPVAATNTQRAFAELSTPIKGAEQTSQQLINPRIAAMAQGLADDVAQSGTVPYAAIKQLRTRIGQELDNGLVSDVPASQWKRLYAALSADMKTAADTPEALGAWRRADNYTSAGLRRIEAIESVINRSGGPEAVFRAATSGTREGATTLRAVMQSTDDEGQRMITATVLRRLGRASAGVQGELGDRFSSETFLTNWNGLSTEAKATLFNRYGDRFRNDMDQIAKFAANLRTGSQVFRNPSGTAQATAQVSAATAFVGSLVLGRLDAAATVAGGVAGANLSARLMTNPRFVRWLAESTRVPQGVYPSMVNRLAQEARGTGDLDLARAVAALEQDPGDEAQEQQGQ